MVALILLAALGAVEIGLYRPQQTRLQKIEKEMQDVQSQLAAASHRRIADREILEAFSLGADGAAMKSLYSDQDALVYLNGLIDDSNLARVDFKTEAVELDGTFRAERFYVALQGSYGRVFNFIKAVETGKRLARVEEFRIDPVENLPPVSVKMRVIVYSLPQEGSTP